MAQEKASQECLMNGVKFIKINIMKNRETPIIYNVPGSRNIGGGELKCAEAEIESKFVTKVVELISAALDVSYKDKRNFEALLYNLIHDDLNSRYERSGLLQQYLAHELENLASTIKGNLRIPNTVKVDHDHATHAKFNSITSYITENFVKIEDINSDGTFEKINEKKCNMVDEGPCDCSGPCDEASAEIGHSIGPIARR